MLQLVHLQETHADREFQIHPCKVFEPRNEMSTLLQVLRNFQLRDVHVQMRAEAVLVSTFSISHASQSICCELAFAILPCRQFWFSVARTLPGPYHRHNLCCIRIAAAGWAGGGLIRLKKTKSPGKNSLISPSWNSKAVTLVLELAVAGRSVEPELEDGDLLPCCCPLLAMKSKTGDHSHCHAFGRCESAVGKRPLKRRKTFNP